MLPNLISNTYKKAAQNQAESGQADKIRESQRDLSQLFRKKQSGMAEAQAGAYEQSAKQNLARQLSDTRAAANQRGLLYSGLRQGQEASLRADTLSDIARKRFEINQALEDQSLNLERQSLGAEFENQAYQQRLNQIAMQRDLADQQQSMDAYRGLGQAAGGILGMGAAKYFNQPGKPTAPITQNALSEYYSNLLTKK